MKYRKITIDLNLGDRIKHLEIDNEVELKEYYKMKKRIEKAIEYIDEHTLFVNGGIIKSILNGSDNNE